MSSTDWPSTNSYRHVSATEQLTDHRERLAVEEEERVNQRARQLEELRSEVNSAPARIRAWEKMHGLRLPISPTHPILAVIAGATGIPLPALRQEQQARGAKQQPPPAATKDDVTDG
jgi:hypothetical protein